MRAIIKYERARYNIFNEQKMIVVKVKTMRNQNAIFIRKNLKEKELFTIYFEKDGHCEFLEKREINERIVLIDIRILFYIYCLSLKLYFVSFIPCVP